MEFLRVMKPDFKFFELPRPPEALVRAFALLILESKAGGIVDISVRLMEKTAVVEDEAPVEAGMLKPFH